MGSLNLIQQMLLREHPDLESNILSSSEALHVWRNKSDIKGLRYLPNFHLIFQAHNDENLTVKLMTFHGKTVDSRAFKQHNEDLPEHVKEFIEHYSTGLILCQVCKVNSQIIPKKVNFSINFHFIKVILTQRCS